MLTGLGVYQIDNEHYTPVNKYEWYYEWEYYHEYYREQHIYGSYISHNQLICYDRTSISYYDMMSSIILYSNIPNIPNIPKIMKIYKINWLTKMSSYVCCAIVPNIPKHNQILNQHYTISMAY